MSKRYPYLLVSDILQCIDEMAQFTDGMTYEDFIADKKTFRAVLASALIMGEAVSSLDEATMNLCPEVEWHRIRGFRNRLIHAYFDIDSHILWSVATQQAQQLRTPLLQIRDQLPNPETHT